MIPYIAHKLQELAQKMEEQLENLAKKIEGQTEQLTGEGASLRETCEKLVIQMAAK